MKQFKAICQLFLGLLRELGDQTAYQRYLARHGRQPSREAWQRFWEERLDTKYQQAKCC